MNIEEFYDADSRRRRSAELQFGQDWHDREGRRYELNWIEDTGELYVMQDDPTPLWFDPFGDVIPVMANAEALGVRVIKHVHGRETVERLLAGWEEAMPQEDSVSWLVERISSADPS